MATHYLVYALDGIGMYNVKLHGRVFEACAEILMLLLLILIAKGYTVTRARLRQASAVKVTLFISLYCVTYTVLFIFEQKYFDPGEVRHHHQVQIKLLPTRHCNLKRSCVCVVQAEKSL